MKQYHPIERKMSRAEYRSLLLRSVQLGADLDPDESIPLKLAKFGLLAGSAIALLAYGLMWGLR